MIENYNSLMCINNPFDSHVHWQKTGQQDDLLKLFDLNHPHDVGTIAIKDCNFRGEWLVGFGWDHHQWDHSDWPTGNYPTRHILDKFFPDIPVALKRIDGHALWANSCALKRASLLSTTPTAGPTISCHLKKIDGGQIVVDDDNLPTGILIDLAIDLVTDLIPPPTGQQIRLYLQKGMEIFNRAGITHIRNMSCSTQEWNQARELDVANQLTLAVEQFFSLDSGIDDFDQLLEDACIAKKIESKNLRAKGIKIYFDGALGSDGALLSRPYGHLNNNWSGLQLINKSEFQEILIRSWEKKLEVAVHSIGDQASDLAIRWAVELWQKGYNGRLHLEHAEIVRTETICLMKNYPITCHMQPSHWLTDKKWIDQKILKLKNHLFPWKMLTDNHIDLYFGSDSPIEPSSISRTILAIRDAAQNGIPAPDQNFLDFHQHPDQSWAPNSYALMENKKIIAVSFRGEELNIL